MMARATSRDSGTYTCSVDNQSASSVSVHVLQGNNWLRESAQENTINSPWSNAGEEQAAVQELTGSARSILTNQPAPERHIIWLCFLCCVYPLQIFNFWRFITFPALALPPSLPPMFITNLHLPKRNTEQTEWLYLFHYRVQQIKITLKDKRKRLKTFVQM